MTRVKNDPGMEILAITFIQNLFQNFIQLQKISMCIALS